MMRSLLLTFLLGSLHAFSIEPLNLVLPTENDALLRGKPEDYYMYVHRYMNGVSSKPWTGGQYGFVRTLKNTQSEGIIATKFHEGLDIKPIKRDRSNNPLDKILSIAKGTVVYINNSSGGSSYGKYLVVEHNWGYGPFFSLYAHLSSISAEIGQKVLPGSPLGVMGFTGVGINRERSHLHLELNMLATEQFDAWHQEVYGGVSPHGIHNGINLMGIDVASLLLAQKKNTKLSIPQFLATATPYFKVAIPRKSINLALAHRYPWLKKGDHSKASHSWEISFTDSGIPLAVTPSFRKVTQPTITFVRTTRSNHEYYTRKRLTGTGRKATLTKTGKRFIALFTDAYVKAQPTQ